jgi:hypothetical protein
MKKDKYPYILNETTARFDFESRGPNGTMKKQSIIKKLLPG